MKTVERRRTVETVAEVKGMKTVERRRTVKTVAETEAVGEEAQNAFNGGGREEPLKALEADG
ncbi:MAG: hypothetical protein IJ991_06045 [Thermoguttaceae bacterium]|nr:hypothetical protein [Thermoguttaceae bacterium]